MDISIIYNFVYPSTNSDHTPNVPKITNWQIKCTWCLWQWYCRLESKSRGSETEEKLTTHYGRTMNHSKF